MRRHPTDPPQLAIVILAAAPFAHIKLTSSQAITATRRIITPNAVRRDFSQAVGIVSNFVPVTVEFFRH